MKVKKITVKNRQISIVQINNEDYISLTDMVKNFGDDAMIYQWMRNRNTVEFIGIWEQLHNPKFKGLEFDTFKKHAKLISDGLLQSERLIQLNKVAINQLRSLLNNPSVKKTQWLVVKSFNESIYRQTR
jgi:hypothetical protein